MIEDLNNSFPHQQPEIKKHIVESGKKIINYFYINQKTNGFFQF